MSIFHLGAVLVGLVVFLGLLRPLLAPRGEAPSERRAVLAVYRQRLAELAEQAASGQLDLPAEAEARRELEAGLAAELDRLDAREAPRRSAPAWASALVLLLLVPAVTLWLYAQTGGYPEAREAADQALAQAAQRATVEHLAERLHGRLDDVEGWWLLGRSWLQLGEPARAVAALAQAYSLAEPGPELSFDYARALASLQENRLVGAPKVVIERNLERFPEDGRLLWLAVLLSLEEERREEALARLDRLITSLPPGSEDITRLGAMREQIAGRAGSADGGTAEGAVDGATPASIRVSVSLDPELAARTTPEDTVFVYARAVDGPPMPLAVARARVADLPLEVTLDDSHAMAPQFRLSTAERVNIGARISRGGRAEAASGDIDGQAETPVDPRAPGAAARVVLGRVVP
jgi:cytochrome c-type biogenesis protein CcmH